MPKQKSMRGIESFVGSASILFFGFITIPLAGWLVGVSMSASQGASMSLLFFFGRWALLYCIRGIFERFGK